MSTASRVDSVRFSRKMDASERLRLASDERGGEDASIIEAAEL
jgi:hypothetical protein